MRNAERSAATRGRLVAAARERFAAEGYAGTATETILAAASVTRGAMYHHFADKAALFEAVCLALSDEAVEAIRTAAEGMPDALSALRAGSLAWIDFMLRPDVRQILVLDAPSVLGFERWSELDRNHAFRLLEEGIAAALEQGRLSFSGSVEALSVLLSGAMNAAVLRAGSEGGATETEALKAALTELLDRLSADTGATDSAPARSSRPA